MMSPKYLLLLALAFTTKAFAQTKTASNGPYTYHVSGTLTGFSDPYIRLEKLGVQSVIKIDSVKNNGGKFDFSGTDNEPALYRVRAGSDFNSTLMFVFTQKKNDITVKGDSTAVADYNYTVSGSAPTEQLRSLMKTAVGKYKQVNASNQKLMQPNLADSLRKKYQKETETIATSNRQFMHAYTDTAKNPVITVFAALSFMDPQQDLLQMKKVKQRLKTQGDTTFLLAKQFIAYVNEHADAYEQQTPKASFGIGEELSDIAMKDTSGTIRKLSALRGQYVLVDFWASWCGPCRMENPNVVETYNKYKDKGFTVFNVSLDTDRTRWIKAIKSDKLAWEHHVSELKGWQSAVCQQFSINSIPSNFLIDPQGKVVATNLRGADLQTTLASLIK